MIPTHLIPDFDPQPNPKAVIQVDNVRISVLTTRLLRFEYSPTNKFEDRPSQAFWFRNHPPPDFLYQTTEGLIFNDRVEILKITTPDLIINYTMGQPLSPETLSIFIQAKDHTWQYGDEDPSNLKGTYRTLDNFHGAANLEPGLLSRDGWAVVDDSGSLVFNETGWLTPRYAPDGYQDFYFFGYGNDYQACLTDFRKLAGEVPLLPRWVLGNWWSRYWKYNQNQIIALIQEFQDNEVPLSVFIIDMDWHITETGNDSSGWTGYTWNRDLFPDPPTLIRHIHERGLKTALNLHPALGIYPHEEKYPEFAQRLGLDPAAQQPIPFDIADPNFTNAYFELLHHPQEADGLDFWWIDWQQGEQSAMAGLDPLYWLNHLHFYDLARPQSDEPNALGNRSFIFSRWSGLGNHRYPIGFSGDTVVSWESLAFQPFFTATAANVSYGWWSHDIGGHMSGIEDPELYTRWVQYGVLSPIFRLHCTNNLFHERRPWGYDAEIAQITRYAMRLRHAFIPYLYTMSWRDHHDALTPIRPLYHLDPDNEAAYHSPDTYTYGSELVAAPFTTPRETDTRLSRQKIWLPEGDWFNFFTGEHLPGGHHTLYGDLTEIPLFARAGAIVPMAPLPTWGGVESPTHLKINIFPGADNHFELYDDDGNSTGYLKDSYALTPFNLKWESDKLEFTISPVNGDLAQSPYIRTYELKFWGIAEPDTSLLNINQQPYLIFPEYDAKTNSLTVPIDIDVSPSDKVGLTIQKENGLLLRDEDPSTRILKTCQRIFADFKIESFSKAAMLERMPEIISDPNLLCNTRPSVTDLQLRTLLETITRTGVHHITHTGDEKIILWNHNHLQETFPVTYHLTINQLFQGHYDHPYHYESGPVPEFKVFDPAVHFQNNPWELRIIYGEVLIIRLSSEGNSL
jgi:alpha-glucosidase (family GH31 glycosyl hydrolase)